MKIINFTPHEIIVYPENGFMDMKPIFRIRSSGFARAHTAEKRISEVEGIPVYQVSFLDVEDFPEAEEGTMYVVSQITAQALKAQGRTEDILIPHKAVRDAQGKIIGCRAFAKV